MFSETESIRKHLLEYPQGLTQTDLSRQLKINRVSISKYLATMVAHGELECRSIGPAKLYTLTKRLPLKSILAQTEDHVIITDDAGRVTQVGERTAALFDISPELMIGRPLGEGSTCRFFAIDGSSLTARQVNEPESRELMLYSGEHITHFNQKTIPVILTDGSRGNAIILTDITGLKRVEAELRHREHDFASLVQNASDLIVRYDTGLHHIFCNPAVERQSGIPVRLLLGKTPSEIDIFHEQAQFIETSLRKVLETGEELEVEQPVHTPSGVRHFMTRIVPEHNDEGGIISLLAISRDITERKRMEEARLESETRFRELFNNMGIGAAVYQAVDNGTDFVFVDFNPAAEKIEKIRKDEVIGRHVSNVFPAIREFGLLDILSQVWRTGQPENHPISIYKDARIMGWRENFVYKLPTGEIVSIYDDVTERKRIEEALKKSEERLHLVLRGSNDAPWDWDLESNVIYYSPRWWGMLGYVVDEFPPDAGLWERFMHPDDMDRVRHFLEDALKHGPDVYDSEFRLKHKAGHYVPVLSRGFILRDTSGTAVRISGTNTDLTERKQAELKLVSAYESLKEAHRLAHIGTWDWIIETDMVTWSEELCNIAGWDPLKPAPSYAELPRVYTPASWDLLSSAVARALTNGEPYILELELVRPDNSIRWINASGGVKHDESGKVIGLQGTLQDITERKQAELERVTAYESLKEAHRLAHIGTWDWIIETDTVTWSEELYNITGLDPSLPAPTFAKRLSFCTPASWDLISSAVTRALNTGEPYNVEMEFIHSDGSKRWVTAFGGVKRDESGKVIGLQGTLQDITERKRAETELLLTNKKLALLTNLTRHDTINKLTGILGYLDMLKNELDDPTLEEYFQTMATSAKQISSMIQTTNEYEAIGINTPVWHDTRKIVQTAAQEVPLGNVMVKNDLPAGTEIFANPLIGKIFYNQVENAVQYGGKITTIWFSVEERSSDQVIVCEDDGDGVPAGEKEKIFDRGFGKNTGLGLFLSREILDITGITIKETGEPGKGARFEMTVPKGMCRVAGKST